MGECSVMAFVLCVPCAFTWPFGPVWRRASMEGSLIRVNKTRVIESDYTADTRQAITMVGTETPTTSARSVT